MSERVFSSEALPASHWRALLLQTLGRRNQRDAPRESAAAVTAPIHTVDIRLFDSGGTALGGYGRGGRVERTSPVRNRSRCVRACVRAARSLWLENQRRRWCCSAHTISLLLSIKLPLRSKCVISLTRGSRNGLVRDRRGRLCFRETRERLNGLKSIPWLVCWKHEIFQ